jgi:hypothetical protein
MIFNDISIMCVTNIDDIDEMYLSMIMMISTINNNNMYIYLNMCMWCILWYVCMCVSMIICVYVMRVYAYAVIE